MVPDSRLDALITHLPKVELHLHIEGTLEPEMVFALAARNGMKLPYRDVESLRDAYLFSDLQSFLDIYYASCAVLITEEDFYEMTAAYLRRASLDHVVHAEIFFDPQSHTSRGVSMETVVTGIQRALNEARTDRGMTSALILCFLRHLDEDDALRTLDEARAFRHLLAGVGLDSGERGNPPSKFQRVFDRARALGLRVVAHAGEEGPAAYIVEALDLLGAERIDHGVRCEEDDAVVARLVSEQVPLTVCPLSNLKLRVFPALAAHNLKRLLDRGVCVTVNSDDPAYFGGYITDNYRAVYEALGLDKNDILTLAANAVHAAFLPKGDKELHLAEIRRIAVEFT